MESVHRYGETSNNAKRLKLDGEEEGDQNKMAFAIAVDGGEGENIADANDRPSPSIFKLNIDCCEEVFAFLSLVDLHSLGQTCKRMRQFTGYFVRENYKTTRFEWKNGNLYLNRSNMNGFIEFISNLYINSDQLERFAEFAPRFKSIRKLRLYLQSDQIDCIKEILYKCEEIEINFNHKVLTIDLYGIILKFCTNLKHFELNPSSFGNVMLKNNNWLLHEYPKLEFLNLYSDTNAKPTIAEMRTFFTLNKKIRKFRTNFVCLWDFRHWIVDTDIKLDELLVDCVCLSLDGFNSEHINLFNTLYARGFYKHLSLLRVFEYDSSILAKIRAPLSLELYGVQLVTLPPLDLIEIQLIIGDNIETILANNFSTIERVYSLNLKTEKVLFLIQNCMKLREIKIDSLIDENPLNLTQLNEERKKLVGAKNVTIYLNRINYNQIIKNFNLDLIKIIQI